MTPVGNKNIPFVFWRNNLYKRNILDYFTFDFYEVDARNSGLEACLNWEPKYVQNSGSYDWELFQEKESHLYWKSGERLNYQ